MTNWLENKKNQAPARVRTHDLVFANCAMATRMELLNVSLNGVNACY